MLENLRGNKGLPSPDLIQDLRTLCTLDQADIDSITDFIANQPEQREDETDLSERLSKLSSMKTDPEKIIRAVKVATFLLEQWSRVGISKEQVISDLVGLQLAEENIKALQPLLNAMEKKLDSVARKKAESHALKTGTPQLDSVVCAVDTRAIFKSTKHEKDKGDNQDYFQLERFLPVAILEVVAELNDDKTTQSFLLTEESLNQLCDILDRAKKRMQVVKKSLGQLEGKKDG